MSEHVESVSAQNADEVSRYLALHEETCQFLINNMRE